MALLLRDAQCCCLVACCPVNSFHRDGLMRVDGSAGSTLGYETNSYGEWQEQPDFAKPSLELSGAAARWNHREGNDYYSQPGKLFRLISPARQQVLFKNTARAWTLLLNRLSQKYLPKNLGFG